jgi:hypothetical protein
MNFWKTAASATVLSAAATTSNAGVTCALDLTQAIGAATAQQVMEIHIGQAEKIGANLGRIATAAESINIVQRATCAQGPGAQFMQSSDPTVVVTTFREEGGVLRGGLYNNAGQELAYVNEDNKGSGSPTMLPNPYR